MDTTGLIHIYCGEGKGKTTAAMGLATRCSGGGGKVLVFQFLKNDISGERKALGQLPNVTLLEGFKKIKFSKEMNRQEKEEAIQYYKQHLIEIEIKVKEEAFQLLILDEVIAAINLGFLEEREVVKLLNEKPEGLEVVLTGRNPSDKLQELADYISKIEKVKHPFDRGIKARKLIEW